MPFGLPLELTKPCKYFMYPVPFTFNSFCALFVALHQVGGECEPRGMALNYLLAGWYVCHSFSVSSFASDIQNVGNYCCLKFLRLNKPLFYYITSPPSNAHYAGSSWYYEFCPKVQHNIWTFWTQMVTNSYSQTKWSIPLEIALMN